jgi:hypothetical protein
VVLVFDFGFGQRGAVVDAPVDRLQAFVDVALVQEIDERARDHRLVLRAHGEIRVVPAAETPRRLKSVRCRSTYFSAYLRQARRISPPTSALSSPEFAVDLDLDGQAVAVPAGHVGRIEALHGLRLDDEILEDFVERGAQVDVAVGVGRPVVQDVAVRDAVGGMERKFGGAAPADNRSARGPFSRPPEHPVLTRERDAHRPPHGRA